jgi:Reverse transcriptase (RNA-dependent DNA polymerase)
MIFLMIPIIHFLNPTLNTENVDLHNILSHGLCELNNQQTSYNLDPLQHIDGYKPHIENLTVFQNPPEAALNATNYDGCPDPKTYAKAMTSHDCQNWWAAMCTEFASLHTKQVWKIIPKSNNCKVIGNQWVFVQKDEGRLQAHTVAKVFTQIPGKDFQEISPVINDTTSHSVLVLKILLKEDAGQFNIETAFLYRELQEKLWMELPDGYVDYIQELKTNGKQTEVLKHEQ